MRSRLLPEPPLSTSHEPSPYGRLWRLDQIGLIHCLLGLFTVYWATDEAARGMLRVYRYCVSTNVRRKEIGRIGRLSHASCGVVLACASPHPTRRACPLRKPAPPGTTGLSNPPPADRVRAVIFRCVIAVNQSWPESERAVRCRRGDRGRRTARFWRGPLVRSSRSV